MDLTVGVYYMEIGVQVYELPRRTCTHCKGSLVLRVSVDSVDAYCPRCSRVRVFLKKKGSSGN